LRSRTSLVQKAEILPKNALKSLSLSTREVLEHVTSRSETQLEPQFSFWEVRELEWCAGHS
jgi:hypothetical protein